MAQRYDVEVGDDERENIWVQRGTQAIRHISTSTYDQQQPPSFEKVFSYRSSMDTSPDIMPHTVETVSQSAGPDVLVHPLVLLNISDHITRTSVTGEGQVIGAIMGRQANSVLEVCNSFEFKLSQGEGSSSGSSPVDVDHLERKTNSMKKNFPDLEVVGWYAMGAAPDGTHTAAQLQMIEIYDSAMLVLVDSVRRSGTSDLPLRIFESSIKLVASQSTLVYRPSAYRIETLEDERIAVDHVTHASTDTAQTSQLTPHLENLHSSITLLSQRTAKLLQYLKQVESGETSPDHAVIRQIGALCAALPNVSPDEFRATFDRECNDTLLVALLASITTGCATANSVIDKYSVAYGNRRSHGVRPPVM